MKLILFSSVFILKTFSQIAEETPSFTSSLDTSQPSFIEANDDTSSPEFLEQPGFSTDGLKEVDASIEISSQSGIEKTADEGSVTEETVNLDSEIVPVIDEIVGQFSETGTNIVNSIESELQEVQVNSKSENSEINVEPVSVAQVSVEENASLEEVDDLKSETPDFSLPQEIKVDGDVTVDSPSTDPVSNDDSLPVESEGPVVNQGFVVNGEPALSTENQITASEQTQVYQPVASINQETTSSFGPRPEYIGTGIFNPIESVGSYPASKPGQQFIPQEPKTVYPVNQQNNIVKNQFMNQEFKDGGAYAFRKILQGERLNNNQFFGRPVDSTQVYKPAVPIYQVQNPLPNRLENNWFRPRPQSQPNIEYYPVAEPVRQQNPQTNNQWCMQYNVWFCRNLQLLYAWFFQRNPQILENARNALNVN